MAQILQKIYGYELEQALSIVSEYDKRLKIDDLRDFLEEKVLLIR